jgi:UDP-N-acetylmuramoylalanine--D-glutamate ligase
MARDVFRGRAAGEVAVIGLGKSGRAAAELLARDGHRVYASDAGDGEGARTAAAALAGVGVDAATGGHDLARIGRAALVVASPGVPPEAPPLAAAAVAGVPVVGEVEIGLHYLPALRYVAITGTNGKTTTTAIAGHLLRALGRDAIDAGNIGTPLAELALRGRPPAWAALELSSFQLHDTPSVDPAVGVVTNLSPDHLDRYPSLDAYYGDKARLFANAGAESRWVLNGDDAEVLALHGKVGLDALPGETLTFSLRDAAAPATSTARGTPSCSTARRCCRARSCRCWATTTSPTRSPPRSRSGPPTRSTARHPRARAWPTRSARSARSRTAWSRWGRTAASSGSTTARRRT